MEFKKGLEGEYVILGHEGARWKNGGQDPVELGPGTLLMLSSWRPEGYNCIIADTGEHFFLFEKYLEKSFKVEVVLDFSKALNDLVEASIELGACMQMDNSPEYQHGTGYLEFPSIIKERQARVQELKKEMWRIYESRNHEPVQG